MSISNYIDVSSTDEDWRADALCLGKHPDLWFPPLDKAVGNAYVPIGKAVCERCPVWRPCLQDGLDEYWGTWGGLSSKERQVFHPGGAANYAQHGTFVRYRQGCRCSLCAEAHDISRKNPINLSVIPNVADEAVQRPDVIRKQMYRFS